MLFLVAKFELGTMEIVDVERGADPIDDHAAGFSRNKREAVMTPFPIRARQPRLEGEGLIALQPTDESAAGELAIVGMNVTKAVFVERRETAEISRQRRI